MIAEDAPLQIISTPSPSTSWAIILERIAQIEGKRIVQTVNGLDIFGLTIPEVHTCIEGLDRAEYCKEYKFRRLQVVYTDRGEGGGMKREMNGVVRNGSGLSGKVGEGAMQSNRVESNSKRIKQGNGNCSNPLLSYSRSICSLESMLMSTHI